ncbi:MAG: hypothetical protein PUA56_06590 [Bacillales bacterium]|nr:hypothetical protein [Bacillales bacterium]
MNLKIAQVILEDYFNECDLDFEFEKIADGIRASSQLSLNGIDGAIFTDIAVYDGLLSVLFICDLIDRNQITLHLIDKFNANESYLTAFISQDGYLTIRCNVPFVNEANLANALDFVFGRITDEEVKDNFITLTKLTYQEEEKE